MNRAKQHPFLPLMAALLITLTAARSVHAQVSGSTGPSANTIGAVQTAEVPVDMFTGTATVNVPIYTVQSRGASVPVSLSYNTSGIKVRQLGTSVGLGWNLNVGGMITRDVRGVPDEYMTHQFEKWDCEDGHSPGGGYYTGYPQTMCHDIYEVNTKEVMIKGRLVPSSHAYTYPEYEDNTSEMKDDQEADVFYLNVGNYNCKFILLAGEKVELLTPSDVKIEYSNTYTMSDGVDKERQAGANGVVGIEEFVRHGRYKSPYEIAKFIVTTPDGMKYYFEHVERTMTGTRLDTDYGRRMLLFGEHVQMNEYNSTWRLSRIVEPINNETLVEFIYQKEVVQTPDEYITSGKRLLYALAYYQTQMLFTWRLQAINWQGSKVNFNYGIDRQDVTFGGSWDFDYSGYFTANKPKLLTSIDIYANAAISDKISYLLTYSSQTVTKNYNDQVRHFLDNVKISGTRSGVNKQVDLFSFNYNSNGLSHIDQRNEDYWGYNIDPTVTGSPDKLLYRYEDDEEFRKIFRRSSTLFQRQSYSGSQIIQPGHGLPDEVYIKAGVLNRITNAAGHITDIDYEIHDFIDPNIAHFDLDRKTICNGNIPDTDCPTLGNIYDNYIVNSGEVKKVNVTRFLEKRHLRTTDRFCFGWGLHDLGGFNCTEYTDLASDNDRVYNFVPRSDLVKKTLHIELEYLLGTTPATIGIYADNVLIKTLEFSPGYANEYDVALPPGTVALKYVFSSASVGFVASVDCAITMEIKSYYDLVHRKDNNVVSVYDLDVEVPSFELTQGNHSFKLERNAVPGNAEQEARVNIDILKFKSVPNNISVYKGGGLRIKKITVNDGQNTVEKIYEYKDEAGLTSGRLLNMPEFDNSSSGPDCRRDDSNTSNSNLIRHGLENTANVAYKRVKEIIAEKGYNISTYNLDDNPLIFTNIQGNTLALNLPRITPVAVYHLDAAPFDVGLDLTGAQFYFPVQNSGSRKSQLISSKTYNAQNQLTNESSHQYQNAVYNKKKNIYKYKAVYTRENGCNIDHEAGEVIYAIEYDVFGFDDRQISSTTTSYKYDENNNQSSSTSSVTYEYRTGSGAVALPSATITVSGGITTRTENTVVADLPGSYPGFMSKHMLYMPVESKTYRGGVQIGGEKITYDVFGSRTLPKIVSTWMYDRYVDTKEYLAYTARGEPTSVKDLLANRTTVNVYRTDFEALESTTYNGRTVSYTYYPDRLLHTKNTSADGITLTYEYDALGVLKKTTEPVTTLVSEYEYALGGGQSVTTEKLQKNGRTYPDKVSKYSAGGSLLEETVGDGLNKHTMEFYRSKVESESTFSKGKTIEQYEPSLNPSWKKTSITTWPGEWTEWSTYTGGSAKTKVIDPDGRYSETVVDGLGRVVSKGKGGVNAGYTYDAYGRLTQISQPGGGLFTNSYSWDGTTLTTTSTVPGGGTTVTKTNRRGQVTEMTDEMGRVFTYEYDSQDRLSVEKLGGAALKTYTYYNSGINVDKVATITHRTLGNTIVTVTDSYTYDNKGRLINEGYSSSLGGGGRSYEYNNEDFAYKMSEGFNVTGMTGASAAWRYTTNDNMHRVANEYLKIGNGKEELVASYGYNAQKKVSSRTLGGNLQTIDYEYNGADWLKNINYIKDCVYDVQEPPKDGNVVTNMGVVVTFTAGSNPKQVIIKTAYNQVGTYNGNTVYTYNSSVNSYANIKQNINRYPGPVTVTWTGLGSTTVLLGTITQRILDSIIVAGGGGIVSNDSLNIRTDIRDLIEKGNRKPCILDTDDAFAEEILYNYAIAPGNVPMKGGLICGTRWQVGSRKTIPQYAYSYDGRGWLTGATYRERNTQVPPNHANAFVNNGAYDESIGYVGAGDISAMSRSGYLMTSGAGVSSYGGVDAVSMSYANGRMQTITELGSQVKGWQTTTNAVTTVSYDAAGNILRYPVKGISDVDIEYNHLNLPQKIVVRDKGTFTAIYDAMGRMWSYTIQPLSGSTITRYFRGGWEAIKVDNNAPQVVAYNHAHGRHVPWVEGYIGEYAIADHIGNQRVFVRDENGNGRIDHATEIWHEKHYYPYGQPMEGNYSNNTNTGWYNRNADPLKECYDGHNNMDFVAAMELDMYFTTFRSMDPGTGRWMQIDPYASDFAQFSAYSSMGNNPVSVVDPDGDWIHIVVGAVVGAGINVATHWDDITRGGWDWGAFGKAAGIGAVAGGVTAATGGAAAASLAGYSGAALFSGTAVGAATTGVVGGATAGLAGSAVGSPILGFGNKIAFGDPYSLKHYGRDVMFGTLLGGASGGVAAWIQGKPILTGINNYDPVKSLSNPTNWFRNGSSTNRAIIEIGDLTGTWIESTDEALFPTGRQFVQGGGSSAAKGGTKLLNQFNSAESLIKAAQPTFGKALKHGELQGFVKGNADAIFKSITNGGTALPSGAVQMSNGTIINMYNATSTGARTLFINTPSQIYKIRITP